ncbi:hypothetical protein BOTBODRAFT_172387 [Botryobasidium botryosum FD-172 SS1]|uniref:Transcription factor domain-containing protein n=1 Tax=Botryobasidium botryosum (strain FD-172 SS1) TaxID=930990 RepID=A0A067N0R9_BOTB1|nr:hypothetical protein BOTBODRAFT_172387 [Botryobasidium botryosum FD-172 SS1]
MACTEWQVFVSRSPPPECNHCARRNRRKPGRSLCEYDEVPRKRGPSKRLGGVHQVQDNEDTSPSHAVSIRCPPACQPTNRSAKCHWAPLPFEPSLEFNRKSWWDDLLRIYSQDRHIALNKVVQDLRYLFESSHHWMSLINVTSFFVKLYDPLCREHLQPSVVLAALALSVLLQSGDDSHRTWGSKFALKLRTTAQSALEASVNARWVDPSLAQAAYTLALFETCTHPEYSADRVISSFRSLDSIIAAYHLTCIDVDDANSSVFLPHAVPSVYPSRLSMADALDHLILVHSPKVTTCTCSTFMASSLDLVSKSSGSPGWDPSWTSAEVQQEEIRRLCWNSLELAAGHLGFTSASAHYVEDLTYVQPSKYGLLFPAETMYRSELLGSPKESIWALLYRSMLLFRSCISRLRKKPAESEDEDDTLFAASAWAEVIAIQSNISGHVCSRESARAAFSTRILISEIVEKLPVKSNIKRAYALDRSSVEEWLQFHLATGLFIEVWLADPSRRKPYFIWLQMQLIDV